MPPDEPLRIVKALPVQRTKIYLHPGQIYTSTQPIEVSTILGSCVSVCLWDRDLKAGGINHFLLPYPVSKTDEFSLRFGNMATESLIERVVGLGCNRAMLQAKLFGGASVFANTRVKDAVHLGLKNVAVAREILHKYHIPIVNEDVGGELGRKVIFQIDDGIAWVKVLQK